MFTILALAIVAALVGVGVVGLIKVQREQERQLAIALAKLHHPAGKGRTVEAVREHAWFASNGGLGQHYEP